MSKPKISEDLDVKITDIAETLPEGAAWLAMHKTETGVQLYLGMIPEDEITKTVKRFKEALDDLVLLLGDKK